MLNIVNQHGAIIDDDAIVDEDGSIKLVVFFNVLAFRPREQEVLDCLVENVQPQFGIYGFIGPAEVFIQNESIPANFIHKDGFMDDENTGQRIQRGTKLRFRVQNVTDDQYMRIVGQMHDDYLGIQE